MRRQGALKAAAGNKREPGRRVTWLRNDGRLMLSVRT